MSLLGHLLDLFHFIIHCMLFNPLLLVTLNVNHIPHLSGLSCCGLMGAAGWGYFRSRRVPSDGAPAVFGSPPWPVGSAGAPAAKPANMDPRQRCWTIL